MATELIEVVTKWGNSDTFDILRDEVNKIADYDIMLLSGGTSSSPGDYSRVARIVLPGTGRSATFDIVVSQWAPGNLSSPTQVKGSTRFCVHAAQNDTAGSVNPDVNITKQYGEISADNIIGLLTTFTGSESILDFYIQNNDANTFYFARLENYARTVPDCELYLVSGEYSSLPASSNDYYCRPYATSKILEIGSWNMDSTSSVNVAHGLSDWTKITGLQASIINDGGSLITNISVSTALDFASGSLSAGSTNISLGRTAGELYDSASYDDAGINRGFVKIDYFEGTI